MAYAEAKRQAEAGLTGRRQGIITLPTLPRGNPSAGQQVVSAATQASSTALELGTRFAAMGQSRQVSILGSDQAYYPPDTQIAAGPAYLMEMDNGAGSIWDKSGALLKTIDLNSFFPVPVGFFFSDPRILYDAFSGRWFVSGMAIDRAGESNSQVYVALSTTSDPTGTWYVYTIADYSKSGILADQPMFGVSEDKLVLSVDDYSCDTCSFIGQETWVVQKAQLLTGSGAALWHFSPDPYRFRIVPSLSLSSTSDERLVYVYAQSELGVIDISDTPSLGNVKWTEADPQIAATSMPPNADQPGKPASLQTNDDRLLSAVWQAGTLWTAGNDRCAPSGDTMSRSCLRLLEVDTGSSQPAIVQDLDASTPGDDLMYPALTLDGSGDLFFTFTASSASLDASVWASGQISSSGALQAAVAVQSGSGVYGYSCSLKCFRWGDYSGAAQDPGNPSQVWVAGEYAPSDAATGDWGTAVALLREAVPADPSNSTVSPATQNVVADGVATGTVTVTVTDANGDLLPNKTVTLTAGGGNSTISGPVPATTGSNGQALFTVKDGTIENVTYTAQVPVDSVTITQTATVDFVVGPPDQAHSTAAAIPTSVKADGTPSTITVVVEDASGHPEAGKTVTLAQALPGGGSPHATITCVASPCQTDTSGAVKFSVSDQTPEAVTFTATDTSDNSFTLHSTASVIFTPQTVSSTLSTLTPSSQYVAAGGASAGAITITLLDTNNQPVRGKTVRLTGGSGNSTVTCQVSPCQTDAGGAVLFSVKDGTPETVTYTATDTTDSPEVPLQQPARVTFTPVSLGPFGVSIQPAVARVGTNRTVVVSLQVQAPSCTTNAQGTASCMGGWDVTLAFDSAAASFTTCAPKNGTQVCQIDGQGQLEVSGVSTAGLGGSTELADLTFTGVGTAAGASTALTPALTAFVDPEANAICANGPTSSPAACVAGDAPLATAGTITIGLVGDVNGDGTVDATDALCVLRIVAALPSTNGCPMPAPGNPDVNNDPADDGPAGADATDALCILRYVALLAETAGCPAFGASPAPGLARPAALAASPSVTAQVRLSASSVNLSKGKQATVDVTSEAIASGLGSWTVDVGYDATVVTVVDCQAAAGGVCNTSYAPGVVRITGVSTAGLVGSRALATLSFVGLGHGRNRSGLSVQTVALTDPSGAPLSAARATTPTVGLGSGAGGAR